MKNTLKGIVVACVLNMSIVAANAASVTTMYVNNGNNIVPLDISSGSGAISNSLDPTISMSNISAVISTSRDEKFAYAINAKTHTVSIFHANDDGSMANLSLDVDTGGLNPSAMLLSRSTHNYAYITNKDSNTVSMFKINHDTGLLDPLKLPDGNSCVATGGEPVALTDSPDGKWLFVANKKSNNISMYAIASDGVLSAISSINVGDAPVALRSFKDKSGSQFLHVLNDGGGSGGSINFFKLPETGSTLIKTQPEKILTNGQHPSSMLLLENLNNSGKNFVYVTNKSNDASRDAVSVFQVTEGGTLSLIQSMLSSYAGEVHATSSTNSFNLLSIDPRSSFIYFSNPYNGTIASYTLESATGKIGSSPVNINQQSPQESGGMNTTIVITAEPADPTFDSNGSEVVISISGITGDIVKKISISNPDSYTFIPEDISSVEPNKHTTEWEVCLTKDVSYPNENVGDFCVTDPEKTTPMMYDRNGQPLPGSGDLYYNFEYDDCRRHDQDDDPIAGNGGSCYVYEDVENLFATEYRNDFQIAVTGIYADGTTRTYYSQTVKVCYNDTMLVNGCD